MNEKCGAPRPPVPDAGAQLLGSGQRRTVTRRQTLLAIRQNQPSARSFQPARASQAPPRPRPPRENEGKSRNPCKPQRPACRAAEGVLNRACLGAHRSASWAL